MLICNSPHKKIVIFYEIRYRQIVKSCNVLLQCCKINLFPSTKRHLTGWNQKQRQEAGFKKAMLDPLTMLKWFSYCMIPYYEKHLFFLIIIFCSGSNRQKHCDKERSASSPNSKCIGMLFFGLGVPLLTNVEFQKFLSLDFKSS